MTTGAQIRAALSSVGGLGGQAWTLDTIAAGADDAMRAAGITTRQGAACLVAQCMVESAYFRTTREYGGSSARYAPYYGRGFIQVTWEANYRSFGKWCHARGLVPNGNWFMAPNQDRLAHEKWAWLGAVWYLTTHRHGLIALANRGDNIKVGRAINRGDAHSSYAAYGESHRRQAYSALLSAGITAPSGAGAAAAVKKYGKDDVKRMQRQVGVPDDGKWGPGTERNAQAIRHFLKGGLTATAAQRKIYMDVRAERPKGKRTTVEFRKGIQWALGVTSDGIWGRDTEAHWQALRSQHKMASVKDTPDNTTKKAPAKKPAAKINPRLVVDGKEGPATVRALQRFLKVAADGKRGPATNRELQKWVGVKQDGVVGPATIRALQRKIGAKVDGALGPNTIRALQRYLNKH